ncbi:Elongin-C [Hondaea fermentalgiana]|uniref:Elongin-C n=1 Tax=Hondaea fermentalgiana TaxID=2315210 RepID=A0A2R5GL70_9STRA|nr:Elongin-C [Hondaea fermentalgiana]|eukprot:GBG31385.1 Elongin-C [Hondaea fermentalgiana]
MSSSSSSSAAGSAAQSSSSGGAGAKRTYVKLISAEGHEFFLDKEVAMIATTISAMLTGNFSESKGEIRFPEISTKVLEKVVQYLHYKQKYTNSSQPIPEFDIDPEMVADLLMAANFLNC